MLFGKISIKYHVGKRVGVSKFRVVLKCIWVLNVTFEKNLVSVSKKGRNTFSTKEVIIHATFQYLDPKPTGREREILGHLPLLSMLLFFPLSRLSYSFFIWSVNMCAR